MLEDRREGREGNCYFLKQCLLFPGLTTFPDPLRCQMRVPLFDSYVIGSNVLKSLLTNKQSCHTWNVRISFKMLSVTILHLQSCQFN